MTVVNDYYEGVFPSLAFDPLNRPMIVHYDDTNVDLRFSVLEPGVGWVTTTIDSASGTVPYYPSLAIDPDNGYPAIAYYYPEPGDPGLRYAGWDGDEWVVDEIVSGSFVGQYPSLAFDPADGNPAISYRDNTGDDLALAWHDGSSWQTQFVDTVGNVGWASSLAFNDYGTGFPSICLLRIR